MGVQAFRPELAIERLDLAVVPENRRQVTNSSPLCRGPGCAGLCWPHSRDRQSGDLRLALIEALRGVGYRTGLGVLAADEADRITAVHGKETAA